MTDWFWLIAAFVTLVLLLVKAIRYGYTNGVIDCEYEHDSESVQKILKEFNDSL